MEEWKTIEEFPMYEVSNLGSVRKRGFVKPVPTMKAKGEHWFVKLMRDGEQYSRTVKTLVAEAFVKRPDHFDADLFDTPIQRVMNTNDLRAEKIMWRPRWFAISFRRQLSESGMPGYSEIPVMNLTTGNQHASILSACLHDGVLMKDIYRSAGEGRRVFPTGDRYEFMWRIENGYESIHESR